MQVTREDGERPVSYRDTSKNEKGGSDSRPAFKGKLQITENYGVTFGPGPIGFAPVGVVAVGESVAGVQPLARNAAS